MLKTVEDISATKKRLHIEIPSDALESEIKKALNEFRDSVKIPGFRPGKAPIALIEKRFGKNAESDAIEKIVPEYYSKALKEADITPIARPVIENQLDYKRNSSMNITLLVEIMPKIEGLVYEGIKVNDVPLDIKDTDVDTTLARLREEKGVYVPSDEPVSDGDLVTVDYEMKEDGKSFKDEVFKVGAENMPESFSANLRGMKKSEEKEFEVEFPEVYYAKEMAGKKTALKVQIKEVKKASLSAIDDEFAKDLGFESLEKLRVAIEEKLKKSRDDTKARILKAEVLKRILENHKFDAPESLVEEELKLLVAEVRGREGKDLDEALMKELRGTAERKVRAALLLQIIGEKEGIRVSDDDVKQRIGETAVRFNLSPENVMKYHIARDGSLDGLVHSIYEDKALNLLLERAVIEKGE